MSHQTGGVEGNHTRDVSRRQIGELKMAEGDVIIVRRQVIEYTW